MRALLLLSLAACTGPVIEPAWRTTHTVCGFEQSELTWASSIEPLDVSEACREAILDDFRVDRQAFTSPEQLDQLVSAASALHRFDLGDDVPARWRTPVLTDALSEVQNVTGEHELRALLYDYVVSRVAETIPGEHPHAHASMTTRGTLALIDLPPGIDGAAILVHEARHADGERHVHCELPGAAHPAHDDDLGGCDADGAGSLGFEAAVRAAAKQHAADPLLTAVQENWLESIEPRILR